MLNSGTGTFGLGNNLFPTHFTYIPGVDNFRFFSFYLRLRVTVIRFFNTEEVGSG